MSSSLFLISSYDALPRHRLHGACFQDEDLILGDAGYENYVATRQRCIEPGQDGAYVVVHSSDTGTVVGTDFSGYCKLFLYRCGERWALSSSFIELVRFVAGKNLPVTIDESHLASFFIEGPFGDQLTSLHTSVREICLVPATMEVVIAPTFFGTGVTLRPTAAALRHAGLRDDYRSALRQYMRLWIGRMATLLQSDLHMRSDLTGGRDSRAVLSLMLAAARDIGADAIRRVNFTSKKEAGEDFAIAGRIAEEYGLRFMDRSEDPRAPVRLNTAQAYETWKSVCLGVYGPIYFPVTRPVLTAIQFGGAGGEGHRQFYPDIAPERFVAAQRRFIPSSAHFRKLRRDILDDLSMLRREAGHTIDPMVAHYRHFRDSGHGGRAPQYGNLLSPLSAADLRRASSLCPPAQIDRSQVLADILINADEKLAALPYDDPGKAFDARHISDVTDVEDAMRTARRDGKVFAAEASVASSGDFAKEKALRLLREDFLDHYERMLPAGYFPKPYLDKARNAVEEACHRGQFSPLRGSCAVAHVILAGELSRLSR